MRCIEVLYSKPFENFIAPHTTEYRYMSSKVLMKNWADKIASDCQNTALITFGQDQTDFGEDYYIQSDGKTKLRKCVDAGPAVPNPAPWGVWVCL